MTDQTNQVKKKKKKDLGGNAKKKKKQWMQSPKPSNGRAAGEFVIRLRWEWNTGETNDGEAG